MNLYLEIEDTLSQLMVRKCGDCNLCCKLPNIHTPKNFKKDYTWCKHCEIGVGCKIYSDRPKMCKDFVCAWLLGLTPEELKPNKVGFYIIVETDESFKEKVFTVYADTHKVLTHLWSIGVNFATYSDFTMFAPSIIFFKVFWCMYVW